MLGFGRIFITGAAVTLILNGCDLSQLTQSSSKAVPNEPATEATVVGIWRTNIPITTTTPPADIKVTMEVDSDHTMLLSYRTATGVPAPNDYVELSHEYGTWSVTDGKMISAKTLCQYRDPPAYQLNDTSGCRAPLTREKPINVKAGAWTVVENDQPIIFRRSQ